MSGRTKNKPEIRAMHHVAFALAVTATVITIIIIILRINVPPMSFFLCARTFLFCPVRLGARLVRGEFDWDLIGMGPDTDTRTPWVSNIQTFKTNKKIRSSN